MYKEILRHPTLTHHEDLMYLCRPLIANGINYFAHVHVDKNKIVTGVCSNSEFFKFYLKHKFYMGDIHIASNPNFKNFIVWDAVNLNANDRIIYNKTQELGFYNCFTIIQKNGLTTDLYYFGSAVSHKSFNQLYFTNLDFLYSFINSFKENIIKFASLNKAYDNKFNPPSEYLTKNQEKLLSVPAQWKNCVFSTELRDIKSNTLLALLSPREVECFVYLIKGKTAKETARCLNISTRTIEEYIDNIKYKTGFRTKRDLLEYYLNKENKQ